MGHWLDDSYINFLFILFYYIKYTEKYNMVKHYNPMPYLLNSNV